MSETRDLATVVAEYGLSTTKAQAILDGFAGVFQAADRWEKAAKEIVVTSEDQTHIMAAARSLRLEIRERRIAVEKSRVEQKAEALREGKAIDGIANVLKALMVPLEKYLDEQENFAKIREQARDTERREKAEALLKEQEEAEEKKRQDDEEADRKRIADENEKLRKENEEIAAKAAEDQRVADEKLADEKAEREKERLENEEKERKAQEDRDRVAAEEQEERGRIAAEEKAAHDKAEATAQRKRDREKKADDKKRIAEQAETDRIAEEKRKEENERHEKELCRARQVKCPRCGTQFDSAEHKYVNDTVGVPE